MLVKNMNFIIHLLLECLIDIVHENLSLYTLKHCALCIHGYRQSTQGKSGNSSNSKMVCLLAEIKLTNQQGTKGDLISDGTTELYFITVHRAYRFWVL
jgi:hypothetical protein